MYRDEDVPAARFGVMTRRRNREETIGSLAIVPQVASAVAESKGRSS
jgi:hypothetical protein